MTKVLFIAADQALASTLDEVARELRECYGATVRLATFGDRADLGEPRGFDETHRVRPRFSFVRGRKARRFFPLWFLVILRNPLLRWRLKRAHATLRPWLLARADPWIMRHGREADVLVALDERAVYTVWELARINRGAAAVRGLYESLEAVPRPDPVAVIEGVGQRKAIAPASVVAVMAAWTELASACAIDQVADQLPVLVRSLRHARAAAEAEAVALAARPFLTGEPLAVVALEQQTARLAQTFQADELTGAVREVLRYADEHLSAARFEQAAELVVRVNDAVFHRELHGEVERSPLAYDTDAFLTPLRESSTYRALVAPSRPAPDPRPAAASTGDRVLALTNGNLHFASGLLADLEANGSEVRVVNLRAGRYPRRGHAEMIADRLAAAEGHRLPELPANVRADLVWADTVFVDWFDVAAQWACLHVPRHVRLVVRVHSIEALSPQPHLVDYGNVSDLVFVGAHVRDLFLQAIPAAATAERVHVVPNEMRLERFGLPKTEAAERTIALVGWGKAVKDPIWALDLLSRLRADDPSWRLLLVGADFHESLTTSGYAYRDAFRDRLQRNDVRDGVVVLGHRTDLPEVMRDVGYVLSCSRRESFGVGLVEGAASAAVPIVRDWPMAGPFGGAQRVFPADWIVTDPAEAAFRIRSCDGAERDKVGQAARAFALAAFDWPVVAPSYRAIFQPSERKVSAIVSN